MRPTAPPARPKKNRITMSPPPCTELLPDQSLKRPQHPDYGEKDNRKPKDRQHQSDDQMDCQGHGRDQNQTRKRLPEDGRSPWLSLKLAAHKSSVAQLPSYGNSFRP
jgi:hypothetical protein